MRSRRGRSCYGTKTNKTNKHNTTQNTKKINNVCVAPVEIRFTRTIDFLLQNIRVKQFSDTQGMSVYQCYIITVTTA